MKNRRTPDSLSLSLSIIPADKSKIEEGDDFQEVIKTEVCVNHILQPYSFDIASFLMAFPSGRYLVNEADGNGFYPFTCSCGESVCAGIQDGIAIKFRRYTVEWRIPKGCGYERNMGKRFYAFNRVRYEAEMLRAWNFLKNGGDARLSYYMGEHSLRDVFDYLAGFNKAACFYQSLERKAS